MPNPNKKSFSGLAGETLAPKGFGGIVTSPSEEGKDKPVGKSKTNNTEGETIDEVLQPDARKYETFSVLITHSEKIKDYTHQQRLKGNTDYRYKDALDDLLAIAFEKVGPLPERPDSIKVKEKAKGRKGSPGNKVARKLDY
jgi:ssRNA-specific RNase YbeY (16S rRNA maturation enzyme)